MCEWAKKVLQGVELPTVMMASTTILPILPKRFRKALRKVDFVKNFHVKMNHSTEGTPRLKAETLRSDPEEFKRLVWVQKGSAQVTEVLERNGEIFRSHLPRGRPPERDKDHCIEIEHSVKPPYRRFHRLSTAELNAV